MPEHTVFNPLSDYSDIVCREILENTVAAMKHVYSKLLLLEWIISDVAQILALLFIKALLNIKMLPFLSGAERTETQWKELLESVGTETMKSSTIESEEKGF